MLKFLHDRRKTLIIQSSSRKHALILFIMVRGPKKHLKRLNAPKSWMLDKLTGVFAPKPAPGTSLLLFLDFFLLRVKWNERERERRKRDCWR